MLYIKYREMRVGKNIYKRGEETRGEEQEKEWRIFIESNICWKHERKEEEIFVKLRKREMRARERRMKEKREN